MRVITAQLPEPTQSADRIFVTENAVVVLDGASAFEPRSADPAIYVDTLGRKLVGLLSEDPTAELTEVLADAIQFTAQTLDLHAGTAPSSTVAILRTVDTAFDLLVLGDSAIVLGDRPDEIITDDRLLQLDLPQRQAYRSRLGAGHGYDDEHRRLLAALQRGQQLARNTEGGYWIAEADPAAARNALTRASSWAGTPWVILTTDGAIAHGAHCWKQIAQLDRPQLGRLLRSWREWEATADPAGQHVPRAQRHDDMAVAIVTAPLPS